MARILVVDDDALFRDYLATALRRAGHAVCELPDGREVARLLATERFDALITDMVMPHMDGVATIREARRLAPDLVIFGVSGALADDLPASGPAASGAAIILAKPVEPGKLIGLLEDAIARREARRCSRLDER